MPWRRRTALRVGRSSARFVSHKPDQALLRTRLHDLAVARVRYGHFRTCFLLAGKAGW
jgi:putative transposase